MRSHDTLQTAASSADARAPFARVVCGASGTRCSQIAVEQALEVAGGDGTVQFLAFTDVRGVGANRMAGTGTARAERALADARRAARDAGVPASTELRHHADPRRALVDAARGSDLLVLGGHVHSRSEGMFLGSAAVYALHAADVPVLVARPVPAGRRLAERVMVAAAGAEGDRRAAQVAAAVAARAGGSVTFLHVEGPHGPDVHRHLAEAAADARALTGAEPVVVGVRGRGPDALVAAADELEATLLVLGSRSLAGLRALASVSERVGARAHCPVLVMRDQASADARFASRSSG
jgi:nucleotide-binding universal stress UspA family protein